MEKFILFLLGCFVWQVSVVSAGNLEDGIKFYEQKKYMQAKELWLPLANKGDVRAQYNLALLLYKFKNDDEIENNLQRQKARKYLAMSRSKGLIDGYFMKIPALVSTPVAILVTTPVSTPVSTDAAQSEKIAVILSDPLVWLNQQQKNAYTLQLAAGNSWKGMEKMQKQLLSSQSLDQPHNLYIHKIEKGAPEKKVVQYILVYGIFKTYQDAKKAVGRLPESILKSSPWIRQFGVLQSIVSAKQGNEET